MGNSASHVKYHKLSKLREKQHELFFDLQAKAIDFPEFKSRMILTYDAMRAVDPGIHCYYETVLRNNVRDAADALSRNNEFNADSFSVDPFPADHFGH